MRDVRFSPEDRALLDRAASFPAAPALADLTPPALARVAADHGHDFAVALLYDRLRRSDRHGPFIRRIDGLITDPPPATPVDALLAVVPGAFYKELPQTGGDGRLIRQQAAALGYRTALIPTASMGPVADNGRAINDWLAKCDEERVLLVSLSKGSADVKAALAQPEAADAFRRVHAWLSLSGMVNGTPVANWLRRSPPGLLARGLFWWKKLDFAVNRQLEYGPGSVLDFPLKLPPHLTFVNVVGFPMARHWTSAILRRFGRSIGKYGPNDGFLVLADSCALPGLVYPVWGADHNLRPAWDVRALDAALAHHLTREESPCPAKSS